MYEVIKLLSNKTRYRIIELTSEKPMTPSQLSIKLEIAYSKIVDYVTLLEKSNLVEKRRDGKKVYIKSKVKLREKSLTLEFYR